MAALLLFTTVLLHYASPKVTLVVTNANSHILRFILFDLHLSVFCGGLFCSYC